MEFIPFVLKVQLETLFTVLQLMLVRHVQLVLLVEVAQQQPLLADKHIIAHLVLLIQASLALLVPLVVTNQEKPTLVSV